MESTSAQVVVTLEGGQQRIGFPRRDGRFTVNDVPPGSHALDVILVPCCVFYQVVRHRWRLPSAVHLS